MNNDERRDVYTQITNTIVAELEKGVRPWFPNWHSTQLLGIPMRANEKPYRGINVLLLWLAASKRGFLSPFWFSYRQVAKMGGFVRKGEKSTSIVYVGSTVKMKPNENGELHETKVPFLRMYSVFNLQQTEGLPESYHWPDGRMMLLPENEAIEAVDVFFNNTGIEIVQGGDVPHYSILYDRVHMPSLGAFKTANDYYSTLAHEVVHATGHPTRTPRNFRAIAGGNENYAREELVAELGAAFLCADLELSVEPRADHAEYIGAWLKVLRHDKRAIFQASSMAQRAVDFIHQRQVSNSKDKIRQSA